MSNFTTSWKFLDKLEEAGKLEHADELEISVVMASWKPHSELEKFVKFYTSWRFI